MNDWNIDESGKARKRIEELETEITTLRKQLAEQEGAQLLRGLVSDLLGVPVKKQSPELADMALAIEAAFVAARADALEEAAEVVTGNPLRPLNTPQIYLQDIAEEIRSLAKQPTQQPPDDAIGRKGE